MRHHLGKPFGVAAAIMAGATLVSACGSAPSASSSTTQATKKPFTIAFVVKDITNPFWVSMINSGKAEAAKLGVSLRVTAAANDSDTTTQINAIEDAVSAGDQGIIVDTNGNAINSAIKAARAKGIPVMGIDTPPIPISVDNETYATNNYSAGLLIGKWAGKTFNGKTADIALLDDLTTEAVSLDVQRDHGFLAGMGIPVGNPNVNGKEPKSGHYSGGKGGSYQISCQLPTGGAVSGGDSAMETCLSKDPNINLVYTINEPAAEGAIAALKAVHKTATVVTIDGGCAFRSYLVSGEAGADAGQAPGKMATLAIQAIVNLVNHGIKPKSTPGEDYYDTGETLYTNHPVAGVPSVNTTHEASLCWGA